jgi:hypothetical protein
VLYQLSYTPTGRLYSQADCARHVPFVTIFFTADRSNRFAVVFHERKRLVEMVQQLAPGLVAFRLPEADRVGLKGVPPHQQQVAVGRLDAWPDLDPLETGGRGDQRPGFGHGRLESLRLAGLDGEDGRFEDHGTVT